jgi:hypothetical protein
MASVGVRRGALPLCQGCLSFDRGTTSAVTVSLVLGGFDLQPMETASRAPWGRERCRCQRLWHLGHGGRLGVSWHIAGLPERSERRRG